jgi:HSP20 family molecular chaperone IbpA
MAQVFESKTDKGLVVDVVAPGYGTADVKVLSVQEKSGDDAVNVIKVVGKYSGRKNGDGKAITKLAFEKAVEDKFLEKFYLDQKYDPSKISYDVENGVVRVRVALMSWAVPVAVAEVANVDAGSDASDGTPAGATA